MMTSNTTFIALVNPRSGGNMGAQLLNRFKEILGESRVYNLNDEQNPGPKKALEKHIYEEDLRIIGKIYFSLYLRTSSCSILDPCLPLLI